MIKFIEFCIHLPQIREQIGQKPARLFYATCNRKEGEAEEGWTEKNIVAGARGSHEVKTGDAKDRG